MKVIMTVAGGVADFDATRRSRIAQSFSTATGIGARNILVNVAPGYGLSAAGDGSVDMTIDIQTPSEASALTVQNVLYTELASVAEASLLLSSAQVAVLRVQAVERVLPSEITISEGSLEDERDGWRTGALATFALLVVATGGVLYLKCGKTQGQGDAPPKPTNPTYEMNPAAARRVSPPPPGQQPPAQVALPPGWFAHLDPTSGHTYYVNEKGESTWSHPGLTSPV